MLINKKTDKCILYLDYWPLKKNKATIEIKIYGYNIKDDAGENPIHLCLDQNEKYVFSIQSKI